MIHLDVLIMGQSYRLGCKEGEQKTLREAVGYLDAKMCALRDTGRVKGTDRIAVMAALSVAAELLSVKSPQGPSSKRCTPCSMPRCRRKRICLEGLNSFDNTGRRSKLASTLRCSRFVIYSLNHSFA